MIADDGFQVGVSVNRLVIQIVALLQIVAAVMLFGAGFAHAQVVQLNSSGGTSTTDGLRIYIDSSSKMQVRRWDGTASSSQLFDPNHTPLTDPMRLDNGIYLRANNTTYGAQHDVGTPDFLIPNNYNTRTISGPTPAAAANGVVQTANALYAITNGPQISVEYRYTRPYDFVTLNVTLTIPNGYSVGVANPVRYYHAIDTYLGGSDSGCGVSYLDSNKNRVVGTYPRLQSGAACPSSTSVPAGVTIVESFRERGGQKFTKYCVAGFQDFWDMNSPWTNCAILNPNGLTTGVTTSYQDTGVAIQYDFTAAGTYTFSYDLVIGSPAVPPYDHLELRYTAGGNLCPMNVTVLGCTSSTVPCPAGYELNANLTGTLTSSGGGGITWTPSTGDFSIASGNPITTVAAQPLSPGGTITIGATGLSSVPLNGVKCWNGSSATCTFTLPNVGCFASDLDACSNLTGSPARCGATGNRLYTKVAGQAMSFDLVALTGSPKAVDTSFNSGAGNPVSVDLVTSTGIAINAATRCPTTSPATVAGVAGQTITFTSGRPATATTYTVPAGQNTQALRNVWVRFNQGAGGTFCSNDRFAIRPAAFTSITSSANADATGASATATPLVKAGASFSLTVNTGAPGYDGTPGVSPALIEWINPPVRVGTLAGSFTSGASAVTGDGATGSAFTYDEVGYFRFQPYGVFDASFTSAYQDASDTVCVNTSPNDFSNTPDAAGKVGCKFGNTMASSYFGRFYPDHFDTTVTQACTTGAFTYSGQPFTVQVAARNAAGATTMNYHGTSATAFAKATTLSGWDSAGAAANPGPGSFTAGTAIAATAFANGVVTTILPTYQFTAANTIPTLLRVRAIDAEGVTSLRTVPATTVEGTTTVRSGRLLLSNAYGSELLPLAVPAKVQYWSANGWMVNAADSCTTLTVPTSANNGLTNTLRTKTAATISSPVVGGDSRLRLSAPGAGNAGLVDISGSILRGANTWLTLPAPSARICFGSCGPRSPVIYFRESY